MSATIGLCPECEDAPATVLPYDPEWVPASEQEMWCKDCHANAGEAQDMARQEGAL